MVDDEGLEELIADKINLDERLYSSDFDIEVDVTDNNVTILGNVPSYYEKRIIEEDVASLSGERDINNKIRIGQVDVSSDQDILSNIEDVLETSGDVIDPENISVRVVNGIVYLSGTVNSLWKKDQLETRISEVDGISNIVNDIMVVVNGSISDEKIAKSIEDALENSDINVDNIDIFIDKGEVTISGNLTDWRERDNILNTISEVKGITKIVDDMIVRNSGIL